jgi:dienelactone hydrolase
MEAYMKRALRIFPLLAWLLAAQDPASVATKALDAVLHGRYAEFLQMASADIQKDLPEATLAKIGEQLKSFGAVENIGAPQTTKIGPNTAVVIPVKFASRNTNFRFLINSSGTVTQFVQLPGEIAWQRPAYSKPDSFTDRPVTVGEGEWMLPGTLTVPAGSGPFPAVVLVHGSGPNDRDETVGASKMFRDLAEGLASRGIVVLRYEKRTRVYGPRVAAMPRFTLHDETVEDAVKAAARLRTQPFVDGKRVFILGHSLGGYAAPRIAAEDTQLAGLILMAANARHLEDLVVDQVVSQGGTAKALENAKAIQAKVKSLEPGDEDSPAVMNAPATYWLDLKDYDPVADAAKVGMPILILQGERDFQVTMTDFGMWKAGLGKNKTVTLKSYPALNHIFVAGEGKSTAAEYAKPGHVAPEVIEDIAAFVKK